MFARNPSDGACLPPLPQQRAARQLRLSTAFGSQPYNSGKLMRGIR
jgi:hypothetical protein